MAHAVRLTLQEAEGEGKEYVNNDKACHIKYLRMQLSICIDAVELLHFGGAIGSGIGE